MPQESSNSHVHKNYLYLKNGLVPSRNRHKPHDYPSILRRGQHNNMRTIVALTPPWRESTNSYVSASYAVRAKTLKLSLLNIKTKSYLT